MFCLYLFRSYSVIYPYSNQATLDSSALKVYDTLISQLGKSQNKKVQKAAKLNALMFARFAQNIAKVISRVKQKPYTAEDFLRERLKVDVNAKYNKELEDAAQYNQESNKWEVAHDVKEAWKILDQKGIFNKTLINNETLDQAGVGADIVRNSKKTEGYKNALKEGISKEEYFSAWANIDYLYETAAKVKFIRDESDRNIDHYGFYEADYRGLKVLIESRYYYQGGNRIKGLYIAGIEKAPLIAGGLQGNAARSEALSKQIIALKDRLRNAYISKYLKNPLEDVKEINEIVYDKPAILEELKNIALEIGATAKPLNKQTPSGYYVLGDKTVRLSNHKSKRNAELRDWDNEFLVNDQNTDKVLSNIKNREELVDFVKGLFTTPVVSQTFGSSIDSTNNNGNDNSNWQQYNFDALYQEQGRTAKGSIGDTVDGQRLIRLFETADQSTFMHEMAHMFLLELQDIAALDSESREAKDLATIVKWAEYKPGQSEEYKGTASEAEFWQREEAIKAAEKRGETVLFLFIKTS